MNFRIARGILQCRSGNIAVLSALLFLPMIIMLGGAIDLIRITSSKTKLQTAVEAGALAAASLANRQPEVQVARAYVVANLDNDPTIKNLVVSVPDPFTDRLTGARQVEVFATADVPLTFLQLLRMQSHPIEVSATAVEGGNIEVAMVLDISASMGHGKKLKMLKTAATQFTELLLNSKNADNTSISIIPFSDTVNIGSDLYRRYVAPIRKQKLITVGETLGYKVSEFTPEFGYRFTGSEGADCIELASRDYDLDDIPLNSRSQVRPENCPETHNAAIWNTNNASALKKVIDGMRVHWNTGMDQGVAWGAKALSPNLRGKLGGEFSNRPAAFSTTSGISANAEKTNKVMVLMSDGVISAQGRAEEQLQTGTVSGKGKKRGKRKKRETTTEIVFRTEYIFSRGGIGDAPGKKSTIGFFKKICNDLKRNGVTIYTIGYELSEEQSSSKETRAIAKGLLRDCASHPSLYLEADTKNIAEVFSTIAQAIGKLRISG